MQRKRRISPAVSESTRRLRVYKYIPERMYGFAGDGTGEVFFHLRVFQPGSVWDHPTKCQSCSDEGCVWSDAPPLPIIGEEVEVIVEDGDSNRGAPRAAKVSRTNTPMTGQGQVETFDANLGYGFIRGFDGESYYLHRSEVQEGRMPLAGQIVMFYVGSRKGRPRACHVKICKG